MAVIVLLKFSCPLWVCWKRQASC